MAFWLLLAIIVAATVVTALLSPRLPGQRPSALGEFQAPTAEEGRTVPVIFGTVKLAGPNVTWYGDLRSEPIKVRSGLFSKTTIGYKYFLGMDLALSHGPIGSTIKITAGQAPDDKPIPLQTLETTANYVRVKMVAPELFGGEKREGGLEGEIIVYRGTTAQASDAYLSSKMGITAPPYRGLCHAVLKQPYLGTSNYLKNLNFILQRFPSNLGLGAGVTQIGTDANPVEIIYDLMTNTFWGLRRPSSRFDLSSFQAAATTLASEGMGMSLQWDNEAEARELIEDVLRHIDGVLFTDPATGLWTMQLARADYDPASLLELSEDDQVEPPEFSRGSWEETWNEVKVRFTDKTTYKIRMVQAQDSASESILSDLRSQTMDFLGFSNAALAQTIAMRELKTLSYPFAKIRIKAKRKAWPLRVASPFKLTWAATGITSLICRVLAINYGRLEKGIIEIDAVEDAFAVAYSAFDPPEDSSWIDPIADPEPPSAQRLEESVLEWLTTPAVEERILVGAVRGDYSSSGYQIWGDPGTGYYHSNTAPRFSPSGLLTADYLRTTGALDATGFTLETARDLEGITGTDAAGRVRGDCLLVFADTGEICAFQGVTDNGDGTWTLTNIVRGVYDTFPADHPEGTRVFILRDTGSWFFFPWKADEGENIEGGGDQFIVIED